jgi:hypothetical protein
MGSVGYEKSKDIKGTASNLIKRQWKAIADKDHKKRIKLGKKIREAMDPYKESAKIGERIKQKEEVSKVIKEWDAPEKWKRKRLKEVEKGTHSFIAGAKARDMAEADVERDLPTSPPKKRKEPEVIEVRKGGRIGMKGGGIAQRGLGRAFMKGGKV